MKRFIIFIILMPMLEFGFSQNLIEDYEYWFNNNYSEKQIVELSTPQAELLFNQNILVTQLHSGMNALNIRFKDNTGKWSTPVRRFFYKLTPFEELAQNKLITEYEYWFNNDFASKQIETISTPSANLFFDMNIPTNTMPQGMNVLNIRFKDNSEKWSSPIRKYFYKLSEQEELVQDNEITTYEYWFNNDFASKQSVENTNPGNQILDLNISATSLQKGINILNIRFKDKTGKWSVVTRNFFNNKGINPITDNFITAYRYWFNDDYQQAEFIQLNTPVKEFIFDNNLDLSTLPYGDNLVNYQFKDSTGTWSTPIHDTVFVKTLPIAEFSYTTQVYCDSVEVTFTNNSRFADTYAWDFGDSQSSSDFESVHTFYTEGTYEVELTASMGANDSTISQSVVIEFNSSESNLTETACNSFILNDSTYTETGVYTQVIENHLGCDSTITLNLTINNSDSIFITDQACEIYTYNEIDYTETGVYYQNYTNMAECDSVVVLDLTIHNIDTTYLYETSCSDYQLNDSIYEESGVYTQVLTNQNECDSIVVLDLIVNEIDTTTINEIACELFAFYDSTYTETGTYYYTLQSQSECDSVIEINLQVSHSDDIEILFENKQDNLCFGDETGSVDISAQGGYVMTASYSFETEDNTYLGGFTLDNLANGNYLISCTDQAGCTKIDSIEITSPEEIIISPNITPITCHNANDAQINISVSGGVPEYTYAWNQVSSTESTISNLSAGMYIISVSDANACLKTNAMGISNPDTLILSLNSTNVSCYGFDDGEANAVSSGGVQPHNISWSNSVTETENTNLQAGVYYVTVDDANNCVIIDSVIITQPDEIVFELGNDTSFCVDMILDAGEGFEQYLWNNDSTSQSIEITESGTYSVTVFDETGCYTSDLISATAKSLGQISGTIDFASTSIPANAFSILLYNIEGTTGYDVSKSAGIDNNFNFSITNIHPGNYLVYADNILEEEYPSYLDSYFGNSTLWINANTLEIGCETNITTNITISEISNINQGSGVISGEISYLGNEGEKAAGEPVEGAEILIQLDPDDYPINNTETDGDGNYDVSNLPVLEAGKSYSLLVDIPGLPLISTYSNIEMETEGIIYNNMNFYVDTINPGAEGIYTDTLSIIIPTSGKDISIKTYPNPVQEVLYIEINNDYNEIQSISLIDISGKEIENIPVIKEKTNQINIDKRIKPGTYFVKITSKNNCYIKKIILSN